MRVLSLSLLLAQAVAAAPALAESEVHFGALDRVNQQPIESVTARQVSDVPGPSERQNAAAETTELENAFWICDYAQTKGLIGMNDEALCSAITDELRRVKFGGEFEKLLAWWQVNKIAQHQELDRAIAAAIASEQQTSRPI